MEEPQVEELQKSYMSKFMDGTTGSLTNQEALTTDESAKVANAILVEDPNIGFGVNPVEVPKKAGRRRASEATEISTNPIVNIKTPAN